jgi:uncharacterized protein
MILQFSVSNFRAFKDRQTLDLVASNYDKSLPENCIAPKLAGLDDRRFVKAAAVYGPNASGKSTVIEALSTLARLVRDSASTTDPKAPIELIRPFALAPNEPVAPTAFSITFVAAKIRFEYRLAATRERVWHESLRAFPQGKEQLWFARNWDPEAQNYQWRPKQPSKPKDPNDIGFQRDSRHESFTLPNALYLSTAVKLNDLGLEPIYRWFKDELHVFQQAQNPVGFQFSFHQILKGTPLANPIIELLRHADIGITAATAEELPVTLLPEVLESFSKEARERMKEAKVPKIQFAHRVAGQEPVLLPWEEQSAGTQRLFSISGPWLDILSKGYTVFVDEFDTSLHPLMAMALLQLFFSEGENKHAAQVIFTTHNPLLLDTTLLRRDQIWFTDKDNRGMAHLYPLSDYKPRKGESLTRGYLSGRYGAIPFISEGLLGSTFPVDPDQETQPRE